MTVGWAGCDLSGRLTWLHLNSPSRDRDCGLLGFPAILTTTLPYRSSLCEFRDSFESDVILSLLRAYAQGVK